MSKIEWTGKTWNPVAGCMKVSAGCTNCYAMGMAYRLSHIGHSKAKYAGLTKKTEGGAINWTGKVYLDEAALLKPLFNTKPTTYFIDSMSDVFYEEVPSLFIDKIYAVMAACPQHTFQVLTKRGARMLEWYNLRYNGTTAERVHYGAYHDFGILIKHEKFKWPLPNVWVGVSTEHQEAADERIPFLLQVPAAVRFLSCEPLLGPLALTKYLSTGLLHQVIAGGESGHKARPMHPMWPEAIKYQCKAASVAFFFKQWGEWSGNISIAATKHCLVTIGGDVIYSGTVPKGEHTMMSKVGKKKAGRLLNGKEYNEMPDVSSK